LEIASAGSAPKVAKAIEFLEPMEDDPAYKAQVIDQMKMGMDRRYFLVGFKNGDVLAVYPKRDDPYSLNVVLRQVKRNCYRAKGERFSKQKLENETRRLDRRNCLNELAFF
jgi:hypothetical protein